MKKEEKPRLEKGRLVLPRLTFYVWIYHVDNEEESKVRRVKTLATNEEEECWVDGPTEEDGDGAEGEGRGEIRLKWIIAK